MKSCRAAERIGSTAGALVVITTITIRSPAGGVATICWASCSVGSSTPPPTLPVGNERHERESVKMT